MKLYPGRQMPLFRNGSFATVEFSVKKPVAFPFVFGGEYLLSSVEI